MGILIQGRGKDERRKPTAPRQTDGYMFLATIIPKAMTRDLDEFRTHYSEHYVVVPTPGDLGSGNGKTVPPSATSTNCTLTLNDLPPMKSGSVFVYSLGVPKLGALKIGTRKEYIISRNNQLPKSINQEVICIPSRHVSTEAHVSINLEERAGELEVSIREFGNLRTFLWNTTANDFLRLRADQEHLLREKAAIAFSDSVPPVVAFYFDGKGLYDFIRNDCKFI